MPLSDEAIEAVASAAFKGPDPLVVEQYSGFDQEPLVFKDASHLADYVRSRLSTPAGQARLFVVYRDMGGRAVKERIHLDAAKVDGHTHRYTWQGWGLISVHLARGTHLNDRSYVSANSEKRAVAWSPTYPEMDPPSTWDWVAVGKHTRRLKRVLAPLA